MTADQDIFTSLGTSPETLDEDARRAVKVFRTMQPTLSAFARSLTGKQVEVVMHSTSNGSTDGKKIFYRPSIELGDPTPHDRDLCDRRDEIGSMRCPACRRREHVLTTIYHEIAHISFDSFEETSNFDRAQVLKRALEANEGRYATLLKEKISRAPIRQVRSYKGLADLVSPYLPHLVNALEDARVNRAMFEARRGTKLMFAARVHKIFTEGFEAVHPITGERQHVDWKDQPLNAQAGLMLFCKASGYDYSDYFAPIVIEAGDDVEVNRLIKRMDTMRSVAGVYEISVPLMLAMRQYGFFQLPEDPEPEPDPETSDEGEPSDVPADEPDDAEESEPESGEDGSDAPEASDGGSGDGGDGEADDESDSRPDGGEGTDSSDSGAGADPDAESEGEQDSPDRSGEDSDEDVSPEGDRAPDDGGEADQASGGQEEASADDTDVSGDAEASPERDDAGDPADASDAPETGGAPEPGEAESPATGGTSTDSDDTDTEREDDDGPAEESAGGGADLEEGSDQGADTPDASDGDSGDGAGDPESSEKPVPDGDEADAAGDPTESGADPGSDLASDAPEAVEPIDTGADDGTGGTELIENPENDDMPLGEWGSPEDMEKGIVQLGAHEKPDHIEEGAAADPTEEAVSTAIVQGLYFETPSRNIRGVREHYWGKPIFQGNTNLSQSWDRDGWIEAGYSPSSIGLETDMDIPETVLGPALLKMRVAFADNQRAKLEGNKKSGRVRGKVLGKRAFHGDERVFQKKHLPGKKDYFVLIGVDVSGSTVGVNIGLAKRAAMAQADLCARMGIKFAVYAHTGQVSNVYKGRSGGIDLDIYHIKDADEPWDKSVRERLEELCPSAANLDGHTMEYYRKVCDKRRESHKIILYYTDGKMPAENHDEELEILQREIRVCRQKNYTLLGVGIRTDSPVRHGLSTVQIDDDSDLVKVIKHLERALLVAR